MSEIAKIHIHNFQSHENTVIEPAPSGNLTVLVGSSDSGKTSILRALRWLYYNVPQGIDFIQVGANFSKVKIDYKDGQSITRSRSQKGFNRYIMGQEPATDGNMFEGFGSTVPLEIQQLTGVRPVEIGDMTLLINLADQLSGPFLGSSISAPARAKVLGKLAGTEELDYAQKSAKTDLYHRKQDEQRFTNDITRLTKDIEQYTYLEELGEKIEQADQLLAGIKQNQDRLAMLKWLRDQVVPITEQLWDVYKLIVYLGNTIDYAMPFLNGAEQNLNILTRLRDLSGRWNKTGDLLVVEESILERTEPIKHAGNLIAAIVYNMARRNGLNVCRFTLGNVKGSLQATERILSATSFVPEAEILYYSCIATRLARFTQLKAHKQDFMDTNFEEDRVCWFLSATEQIEGALVMLDTAQANLLLLDKLSGLSERYDNCVNAIIMQNMRVSKLAGLDDAQGILDAAKAELGRAERMMPLRNSYRANSVIIERLRNEVKELAAKEDRLATGYMEALLAAGVCPVCGGKITSKNLREVI